jgi:transaldolase
MTSKLDQLKSMTIVVADTGDMDAIRTFKPTDCTTNPSLVLKAADLPAYEGVIADAIQWGKQQSSPKDGVISAVADRLAVAFGTELARLVPGRVSTEVDADLSFDTNASVEKGRAIIKAYEANGIPRDKVLIKLASTWEGIRAAEILQKDGIDCNLTLLFSLVQAAACAEAGAFLISPFVGRILDWYVKNGGGPYSAETDPGVVSVRQIYAYYKRHGYNTVVMGASFRNLGEIEALAGCDRLTIAPALLDQLAKDDGVLARQLEPAHAATHGVDKVKVDEASFRYQLNDDAMATEKLAEGIRAFAKDLGLLKTLVAKKLEG